MARENGFLLIVLPLLIGALRTVPTIPAETDGGRLRGTNDGGQRDTRWVITMGVCYGTMGNNLPQASEVVSLYKSNGIDSMRIYAADKKILDALKGSGNGINLMMSVEPAQLADAAAAKAWVQSNVLPYHPAVNFKYIVVGNELEPKDANNILPAMSKLWDALNEQKLEKIKVSTAVKFDVFRDTSRPSEAKLSYPYMNKIVEFLAKTGNPLFVNIYPFFAYNGSNPQINLDYALFKPSTTVVTDNPYKYYNLFDAMVDSVYHALKKAGGSEVRVVLSESGWPSAGEPRAAGGTTVENAKAYNQNLIKHVANGTPMKPGNLETYIFAMFNENQKKGHEVERHFGLFNPDKSPVYPIAFK